MKRIVAWLVAVCVSVGLQAQTQTTGNLVYTTVNPAPEGANYSWSGFSVVNSFGGVSGGSIPGYKTSTGEFAFGYNQSTIAYAIALDSVLSGTGIQLAGIQYGMKYYNQDWNRGTLSTTVSLKGKQGETLESYYHILPYTTEGWTSFDQTKTFVNPYTLATVGTATATVTGKDDRYWAGYYGPMFKDPYIQFSYTVDQCSTNPLSSPTCPNYATFFFNQQCTVSALYNPACPGYAAAYFTQQCTISPLSDPACPGYQEAYFSYQCQLDGLYSTRCPNYADAYAKKQLLSTTSTTTTVATTDTVTTTVPKTDPISIATTSTTTSTTSPTSVTSTTSVITGGTTSATTAVITSTSTQSTTTTTTTASPTTTTEARKTDNEVRSVTSTGSGTSGASSQKSRAETVARQVARDASEAKTFEAQAATQGLQIGLMGFVPGFDAYAQARIIDVNGQQMARLYSRPPVDNRQALRRLTGASDRVHSDMVDQQYQLGR